jgi:hypothetical protein
MRAPAKKKFPMLQKRSMSVKSWLCKKLQKTQRNLRWKALSRMGKNLRKQQKLSKNIWFSRIHRLQGKSLLNIGGIGSLLKNMIINIPNINSTVNHKTESSKTWLQLDTSTCHY